MSEKIIQQLSIMETQMADIKVRMKAIQEENILMRELLEEINQRTRQFKRSPLPVDSDMWSSH
jgi:hypothetical protein